MCFQLLALPKEGDFTVLGTVKIGCFSMRYSGIEISSFEAQNRLKTGARRSGYVMKRLNTSTDLGK
jgi:hypothetical protein